MLDFIGIVPDNTPHCFLTGKTAIAEIQCFVFQRDEFHIVTCVLCALCRLSGKYFGIAVNTQT
jgi:hypothetical protein